MEWPEFEPKQCGSRAFHVTVTVGKAKATGRINREGGEDRATRERTRGEGDGEHWWVHVAGPLSDDGGVQPGGQRGKRPLRSLWERVGYSEEDTPGVWVSHSTLIHWSKRKSDHQKLKK